jgi:molecular chaperone IbpA
MGPQYIAQHEGIDMRNFDFSPLYRSAIGFDRMASMLDSLSRAEQNQPSYPPYNIELTGEDQYRISMAVAGFDRSELNIEVNQNNLTVSANKQADEEKRTYLHQGIAARNFERHFQLADYVQVKGATFENGLLHVDLVREIPEAMKPRTIEIQGSLQHNGSKQSADIKQVPRADKDTAAA